MQVTPQEIYAKLAASGMTLDDAVEVTSKALQILETKQGGMLDWASGALASNAIPLAATAAIGAPLLAYKGGQQLAKVVDDSGANVKELQEAELLSELQQNIAKLRQKRALKQQSATVGG